MTRKKFSAEDREHLVAQFLESRMTQAAFAARAGVCPRTLRVWLARHRPATPTGTATRNLVLRAAAALREAAQRLETAVAGVEPVVTDDGPASVRLAGAAPSPDSQAPVATGPSGGTNEADADMPCRSDDSRRSTKFTFD
jgi:transposase-like protein